MYRNICYTVNNPTEEDTEQIRTLVESGVATYNVAANEIADSGTPHIQGYCELQKRMRHQAVQASLPHGTHFEPRRGSTDQAIRYCLKGDQPHHEWETEHEFGLNYGVDVDIIVNDGEVRRPGKRNDLEAAVEMIKTGHKLKRVAEDNPQVYVKYQKGLHALRSILAEPRPSDRPKTVIVRYGITGTGKTKEAKAEGEHYLWGPEMKHWWNGYDRDPYVIMEEFRGQLPFGYMLRLLDRYEMQVETKGGSEQFVADTICITSPVHPSKWFPNLANAEDRIDQLKRRITQILYYTELGTPPEDVTHQEWEKSTPIFGQFSDP